MLGWYPGVLITLISIFVCKIYHLDNTFWDIAATDVCIVHIRVIIWASIHIVSRACRQHSCLDHHYSRCSILTMTNYDGPSLSLSLSHSHSKRTMTLLVMFYLSTMNRFIWSLHDLYGIAIEICKYGTDTDSQFGWKPKFKIRVIWNLKKLKPYLII